MIKSHTLSIIFASSLLMTHTITTPSPTIRVLLGALFVGTGLTALGEADELGILDDMSDQYNVSKEDIHAVLSASVLGFGIGCLPFDNNIDTSLRTWSFRLPFIAALAATASSNTFKSIVKAIPGIGTYLGACSNEECNGTCNRCKIRTMLTTYTLWHYLVSRPVNWIETSRLGSYLF